MHSLSPGDLVVGAYDANTLGTYLLTLLPFSTLFAGNATVGRVEKGDIGIVIAVCEFDIETGVPRYEAMCAFGTNVGWNTLDAFKLVQF